MWTELLSEQRQAQLLASGQERGHQRTLQLWLQALHALRSHEPSLPERLSDLGFLMEPLIKVGERWRALPQPLRRQGLYPVEPWGALGYDARWLLKLKRAQSALLCASHSASLNLRLNDAPLDYVEGAETLWIDQSCWAVELSAGVNELVVTATGGGLWGLRLLSRVNLSPLKGLRLAPEVGNDSAQRGLGIDAPAPRRLELREERWAKLTRLIDRATELGGARGRALLSDEGLAGASLYASLSGVPEARRLSAVIEAHLRWETAPSLPLLEALSALTPPSLRAQSWGDYPPPTTAAKGVAGLRGMRLWLESARDHLREGRYAEARRALAQLRALYPERGAWVIEEAHLLGELGLHHSAYELLRERFEREGSELLNAELEGLGRWLARAQWERGAQRAALQLLVKLTGGSGAHAASLEPRALQTLLDLSLELSEEELERLGGTRALELRRAALTARAQGPLAWATPTLAAELALQRSAWGEALAWLSAPELDELPLALTLRAEAYHGLGSSALARASLARAEALAPKLERALKLKAELGERAELDPARAARLGPHLDKLTSEAPWGALTGDSDPPPVRGLYHHSHIDLDNEGRLIRRERVALQVLKPEAAGAWRVVRIPHRPSVEALTLTEVSLRRSGQERPPLKRSHEELVDHEARLYYNAAVELIDFGPLERGDILSWEWRSIERSPDPNGVRVHGALIPLQGRAPRALKRLSLGPNARGRFHISVEPRGLWVEQGEGELIARGLPGFVSEPSGPRGASALSYAHVSVLSSWGAVAELYRAALSERLAGETAPLKTLAQAWTEGLSDEAEQLSALYREVTKRVRYVGLEFGQHSFTPAPPAETLARGFGDCKDRAALMIALAAAIGLELHFVMVRTASAGRIELEGSASLGSFNHAALYSPSLKRYFDPTVSHHDPMALPAEDQGAQALVIPLLSGSTRKAARLSVIPYQDSSDHLISLSYLEGERGPRLRWSLRGAPAAEAREQLEGLAEGRTLEWLRRVAPWLPQLSPRSLKLRGLSPVSDPLVIELRLPEGERVEVGALASALEDWALITRFAPSATRRSAWRQLPFARQLCAPTSLTRPHASLELPPRSPHGSLQVSERGAERCLSLELSPGELSPEAYRARRDWLIEAQRAAGQWLSAPEPSP